MSGIRLTSSKDVDRIVEKVTELKLVVALGVREGYLMVAVTGSVDQHGQVQPIGGINQKIEGFFDVCRARTLTGDQGVLIPAVNVRHLMLRQDVRDAVAEGILAGIRSYIKQIESVPGRG